MLPWKIFLERLPSFSAFCLRSLSKSPQCTDAHEPRHSTNVGVVWQRAPAVMIRDANIILQNGLTVLVVKHAFPHAQRLSLELYSKSSRVQAVLASSYYFAGAQDYTNDRASGAQTRPTKHGTRRRRREGRLPRPLPGRCQRCSTPPSSSRRSIASTATAAAALTPSPHRHTHSHRRADDAPLRHGSSGRRAHRRRR